jgi:GPH family glycoside/pentoside/hexuronide:cation symporter
VGPARQYVFVGAIVMGISFVAMWQLYRADGIAYNFAYFLAWSIVFYTGLTLFSIPYVAMGYEMSDDFHERTSIMAVAQWIGQWAWVIAPWFWVVMYDPELVRERRHRHAHAVGLGRRGLHAAGDGAGHLPAQPLDQGRHAARAPDLGQLRRRHAEILNGFKEAFGSVPFRKLCFRHLPDLQRLQHGGGVLVLHRRLPPVQRQRGGGRHLAHAVRQRRRADHHLRRHPHRGLDVAKMGKKNAFMLSQGISIIGYVLLWFLMVPGKPWMFMFALPFFSFGIGGLFTLMMSMTADVCDLDELATGKRREGIFGAIYWWMVKFGFAIAGLLSGAIMSFVGFTPGAATQAAGAVDGLRLFYSGVPIFGTLLAMWIMRDYDLDEKRANEVHAETGAAQAGQAAASVVVRVRAPGLAGRARPAAALWPRTARPWRASRRRDPRALCRADGSAACTACASAPMPQGQGPVTSCRSRRSRGASS